MTDTPVLSDEKHVYRALRKFEEQQAKGIRARSGAAVGRLSIEATQVYDIVVAALRSARREGAMQMRERIVATFLEHHAANQDQADFANAILRAVKALDPDQPG